MWSIVLKNLDQIDNDEFIEEYLIELLEGIMLEECFWSINRDPNIIDLCIDNDLEMKLRQKITQPLLIDYNDAVDCVQREFGIEQNDIEAFDSVKTDENVLKIIYFDLTICH